MKILLLDLWRVIKSKGGTEKVLFTMANALVERGYIVTILALDNTLGQPFFDIDARVKFINAGVGYVEKKPCLYRLKRALQGSKERRHLYDELLFDPPKAELLGPIIESEKPDIIISYNVEATRVLINILKVKCPVITMFHYDPDTILRDITFTTKEALEKSISIQVLLPSYVAATKKYIKHNNIICIPNIVPQYNIPQNNKRQNKIINVARIDGKQKRQHLLIEAFNRIKNDIPDSWIIEFWGETSYDSEYYSYCQKLIKKYSLGNRIKFCGSTNNVIEVLLKAKIFVFPSAFEGFSLAMTEAMSAELPVIGYKSCPAVNEIVIDKQNGLLCDDGEISLSEAMLCLIKKPDLLYKMGEHAKSSVLRYAPEIVWDMWEEEISNVYRLHSCK